MTEHGKIHTDGSRSGGQPVTKNKSAGKDLIDRWYDSEVRQPTQRDALVAENEQLREALGWFLNDSPIILVMQSKRGSADD